MSGNIPCNFCRQRTHGLGPGPDVNTNARLYVACYRPNAVLVTTALQRPFAAAVDTTELRVLCGRQPSRLRRNYLDAHHQHRLLVSRSNKLNRHRHALPAGMHR